MVIFPPFGVFFFRDPSADPFVARPGRRGKGHHALEVSLSRAPCPRSLAFACCLVAGAARSQTRKKINHFRRVPCPASRSRAGRVKPDLCTRDFIEKKCRTGLDHFALRYTRYLVDINVPNYRTNTGRNTPQGEHTRNTHTHHAQSQRGAERTPTEKALLIARDFTRIALSSRDGIGACVGPAAVRPKLWIMLQVCNETHVLRAFGIRSSGACRQARRSHPSLGSSAICDTPASFLHQEGTRVCSRRRVAAHVGGGKSQQIHRLCIIPWAHKHNFATKNVI